MLATAQCQVCRHYVCTIVDGQWHPTCKAFPEGIPDDLFFHKVSHTEAYPGDNSLRFEPMSPAEQRTMNQKLAEETASLSAD
jgi:hypothetical protein